MPRPALAGDLDPDRGLQALEDLADFPLIRYPHDLLRIWELRHNVTAFDAAYIALAETLATTPLVTRDSMLASAARRYAQIELI